MRFSNSFLGSIIDFRFFKLLSFLIIYNDKKSKSEEEKIIKDIRSLFRLRKNTFTLQLKT